VARNKIFFDNLTVVSTGRFEDGDHKDNMTGGCWTAEPIGKGQRGLINAARTGRHDAAIDRNSITTNHPEVALIVLLIDERRKKSRHAAHGEGEVISSTFDERHNGTFRSRKWYWRGQAAGEHKRDVVVLLDSSPSGARYKRSAASAKCSLDGMEPTVAAPTAIFPRPQCGRGRSLTIIAPN